MRSFRKRSIACERRNAGSPRSISKGLRPASASVSAAKRPAHPAPTTTGRSLDASEMGEGNEGSSSSIARTRERSRSATLSTASRSRWGLVSSTRKLRIKWTSRFLRASIDLRWSSMDLISESLQRRTRLATRLPTMRQAFSSPASSSEALTWVISIIEVSLEARKRPSGIPDGPNAFLIIDCAATGCLQRECPRAMPTQG